MKLWLEFWYTENWYKEVLAQRGFGLMIGCVKDGCQYVVLLERGCRLDSDPEQVADFGEIFFWDGKSMLYVTVG